MTEAKEKIAAVAIGQNEGERLKACLRSLIDRCSPVVYVDSGSTDGSVEFAEGIGASVVELDMSMHFTASRARNEGFARVRELCPDVDFVQFVDGDCEVAAGWIEKAAEILRTRPDVCSVCGRRRERYKEASIYNRLADMEWDRPSGIEVRTFGGDVMHRASVLQAVGSYDPNVIGSEDDELLIRMRLEGWTCLRIPETSSYHDANMHRFSQWWNRTKRHGHAYGQVGRMYDKTRLRHYVGERRRIWFYAIGLPAAALATFVPTLGLSFWGLVSCYLIQFTRMYIMARRRGLEPVDARVFSGLMTLAKFPELLGYIKFHWRRMRGTPYYMIHYR